MCLSIGYSSVLQIAGRLPTQALVNTASYHTHHASRHRSDGNGLVPSRLAFKNPLRNWLRMTPVAIAQMTKGLVEPMIARDPFKSIHGREHQRGD